MFVYSVETNKNIKNFDRCLVSSRVVKLRSLRVMDTVAPDRDKLVTLIAVSSGIC